MAGRPYRDPGGHYNNPRGPGGYYGGPRVPYATRGPAPRSRMEPPGQSLGHRPRGPGGGGVTGPRGSLRPTLDTASRQQNTPKMAGGGGGNTGGHQTQTPESPTSASSVTQPVTPITPITPFDGPGADQLSNDCEIIIFDKAQQYVSLI